jgi:hypothetical protein
LPPPFVLREFSALNRFISAMDAFSRTFTSETMDAKIDGSVQAMPISDIASMSFMHLVVASLNGNNTS